MYLVDTNVLSAAAPGRQERFPALVAWMDSHSDSLFLSAVTVAEICDGIAKMRRTGSAARAAGLQEWLDLVLHLYAERVLPFDIAAARRRGLVDRSRTRGGSCARIRRYRHRGNGRELQPHRTDPQLASFRAVGYPGARSVRQPASSPRHPIADERSAFCVTSRPPCRFAFTVEPASSAGPAFGRHRTRTPVRFGEAKARGSDQRGTRAPTPILVEKRLQVACADPFTACRDHLLRLLHRDVLGLPLQAGTSQAMVLAFPGPLRQRLRR